MTKQTNILSYTQDEFEVLMTKNIQYSGEKVKFVVNNGCGEFFEDFSNQIIDWENIKEKVFSEYDGLWKELAKR